MIETTYRVTVYMAAIVSSHFWNDKEFESKCIKACYNHDSIGFHGITGAVWAEFSSITDARECEAKLNKVNHHYIKLARKMAEEE
jgi:hypothetical protein